MSTNKTLQIQSSEQTAGKAVINIRQDGRSSGITGTLRGPFCRYSRTLPSTIVIREGVATVVDPCYWTPRLPFRYELKVDVESDAGTVCHEFMWGIRWCVPHQSNLLIDGKGFVIRGVEGVGVELDLEEYRSLSCCLWATNRLESSVYEAASEVGILIVDTDLQPYDGVRSTASVALQPCVHVLQCQGVQTDALQLNSESSSASEQRSSIYLRSESLIKDSPKQKQEPIPVLAERQIAKTSLSDMRRACDTLQRDLAGFGQFAGYLISSQL